MKASYDTFWFQNSFWDVYFSLSVKAKWSVIKLCILWDLSANASVLLVLQTLSYTWHASGAGMVSAAVFPFIYCHLVDIYLYSFSQNTNWFNCYHHHSSRLPSATSIYDNIQPYGFKGFKEILYTVISIPWLELLHFIGHVIFYICHDATVVAKLV